MSGSVFPGRDLVPEERVVAGSGGLSLLGRERSQEAFEFVGEESGWGSALGELPEIQVFEDVFDDIRFLDHRDDLKSVTAFGAPQSIHLIHLLEQAGPVAPALPGKLLGGQIEREVAGRMGGLAESTLE